MDTLRGHFETGSHDGVEPFERDRDDSDAVAIDHEDETGRDTPPPAIGTDERRMQVRAYNHWAGLLADRAFPSIEDLEPGDMPDFAPNSVLLDFTAGIEDPAVQYLGKELAAECGTSASIAQLSDIPSRSLLSRITDHYMQILANQAPIGFEAEFVNQRGATILYRGILLPYSSDGESIDFIYGVINWKEMADQLTSDELLLEIDQALEQKIGSDIDRAAPEAAAPDLSEEEPVADWADGPGAPISDLPAPPSGVDTSDEDMPRPNFGLDAPVIGKDRYTDGSTDPMFAVDYGNSPEEDIIDEDDDSDWDDDDDAVVTVSQLSSLIQPQAARKQPVLAEQDDEDADRVAPDARSPLLVKKSNSGASLTLAVPEAYEPPAPAAEVTAQAVPAPVMADVAQTPEGTDTQVAPSGDSEAGLHDCLADARELAQAAQSSEDRSRAALYAAVGRAYDVGLAAEEDPAAFADLIAENDLTVQPRAPMTPVVKLVFGSGYDKTRLTEYAAVLSYARREDIGRGGLTAFLSSAEGGLKGVVAAERAIRRGETGEASDEAFNAALARKLRQAEPVAVEDLALEGAEFALVMMRRSPDGGVELLGEVPHDRKLVEKGGRALLK